jgi:hypothetical protein
MLIFSGRAESYTMPKPKTSMFGIEEPLNLRQPESKNSMSDKKELENYERSFKSQTDEGLFNRILQKASSPLKNLFLNQEYSPEEKAEKQNFEKHFGLPVDFPKADPTVTTSYIKFYLTKSFQTELFDEPAQPAWEYCSLRSQYILARSMGTEFTSYDGSFSSKKVYSSALLGLSAISGIECDALSNSLVVYGLDSSETPTMQYVVIRGSTQRFMDDRSIVYKS